MFGNNLFYELAKHIKNNIEELIMSNDKKEVKLKSEPIISIKVGEYTFKDLSKDATRMIESTVPKQTKGKQS